jgi:hypothetical protein
MCRMLAMTGDFSSVFPDIITVSGKTHLFRGGMKANTYL